MSTLVELVPGRLENKDIYVFLLNSNPVAAYVGANGEYDSYYDFVFGLTGSPLADVVGATDFNEFLSTTVHDLMRSGWEAPRYFPTEDERQINSRIGLSASMIRQAVWIDVLTRLGEELDTPVFRGSHIKVAQAILALREAVPQWNHVCSQT